MALGTAPRWPTWCSNPKPGVAGIRRCMPTKWDAVFSSEIRFSLETCDDVQKDVFIYSFKFGVNTRTFFLEKKNAYHTSQRSLMVRTSWLF